MATGTRQAAWRDGADNGWHDDLTWFAAGIHQMRLLTPGLDDFFQTLVEYLQSNPPDPALEAQLGSLAARWDDPRSLGYQSQVHGTFTDKSSWPRFHGKQALWQECAHNQWFFLPWHRAYLAEFEAVVRRHIEQLGGPADTWGLPYWNYSDFQDDPQRLRLPAPLADEFLPDGVEVAGVDATPDGFPNPLFIPVRAEQSEPDDEWATPRDALQRPHFANEDDFARISFGGGVLDHPNNPGEFHQTSRERGELDRQPHASVHVHVGGAMWLFETAGLDPVFWMHHCNIDRLWETFAHDLGHGYPFQNGVGTGTQAFQSWQTQKFRFLRPDATVHTWTAPEVLDVGAMGYGYDTTAAPPLPPAPQPPPGSNLKPIGLDAPRPNFRPLADAGQVALAGEQDVALTAGGQADAALTAASFPQTNRWLLRFSGVRSAAPAVTSYRVYLGVPPGQAVDRDDPAHYAGLLALFGVYEASRNDGSSSGSGQEFVLDVTEQVRGQADLRPQDTTVRLVPLDPARDLDRMGLSIDRISLDVV